MTHLILDTFAGAGGWDMAARSLGLPDPVGIELDPHACGMRAATGLLTIRADVSTFPLDHLPEVTGLISSPPCQSFSLAGKRDGLASETGPLVWEPLRWAKALHPEWIACEQVPPVLPIWRQTAEELRREGYSTWCGILDSADVGTPQHRRRAILMASRVRAVQPPEPSHSEHGQAGLWGTTEKWVSMADALGWDGVVVGGRQSWGTPERSTSRPSPTVLANPPRAWRLRSPGRSYDAEPRRAELAEPAPTVALGHNVSAWCWERPSTTVQGDRRISQPGHHDRQMKDAIPVTISELGVLQDFPRDHPWHAAGTKEAQARAVGNAIPVRLAAAILARLA